MVAATSDLHLAQVNVARLLAPTDDPIVAEFMNNLDRINGLGKRMPGFVWIMEGSGEPGQGNTENCIDGDPQFVANLTLWASPAHLRTFVFDTLHAKFMARRSEWFEEHVKMHFAMWWIEKGARPNMDDALAKLKHRETHGDSDEAFGWDWLNR